MAMFHAASRALQDAFGSRALADRLVERLRRPAFTEEDAAFIASLRFFFIATADPDGQPDCSFKGGDPGFVRVVAPDLLVFPDYDGNGMFKSLGNIRAHPRVGLLFIAFEERPKRLRVNGTAEVVLDDPLLPDFEGAQALVRVRPVDIFPNCPRNIPLMQVVEPSPYVPRPGIGRVEPAWTGFESFADVVPPRRALLPLSLALSRGPGGR
jgi:predicted pyridoxine 5'-phosphate oxidase superfamily flavin-nucleotide-binding protein